MNMKIPAIISPIITTLKNTMTMVSIMEPYVPSPPAACADHIVPLCLGGADNDANLQWQPIAEALEKDRLERAACIAVCRDRWMSLKEAQAVFLDDWRRYKIGR